MVWIKRSRRVLAVSAIAGTLIVGLASPALADQGGVPNETSCGGIGREAQTFATNSSQRS